MLVIIYINDLFAFDVSPWDGGVDGVVDRKCERQECKTCAMFVSDELSSLVPPEVPSRN